MKRFGWCLPDLMRTDIEDLIPFALRFPKWEEKKPARQEQFIDEVDWDWA